MIDSHCHLDFSAFNTDREQVIEQSLALGLSKILLPGTEQKYWPRQQALAKGYPQFFDLAFGLHPYFLENYTSSALASLATLLDETKDSVVAVGEIGLDFSLEIETSLQMRVFEQQLELAQQTNLPVILHHRRSHNELIQSLKKAKLKRGGVVHAFSGSVAQAHSYIEMGFKLGVGGTITYARALKTRDTIKNVPISSLLLETDSPDMPLKDKQGMRNSPLNLPEIVQCLSELREESISEIVSQTSQNYLGLFHPKQKNE